MRAFNNIYQNQSCLKIFAMGTLVLSHAFAQEQAPLVIPDVRPPAGFVEGVETRLTSRQLEEILPWARDAKSDLADILSHGQQMNETSAKRHYLQGIEEVLRGSANIQNELLMRYVLNRALVISRELDAESQAATEITVIRQQIRLLEGSIRMAIRRHESDQRALQAVSNLPSTASSTNAQNAGSAAARLINLPYKEFGIEYFEFLFDLNRSVVDASAQYKIALTALGLLQWDLYRDDERQSFAPAIVRINNFLKDPDTLASASFTDEQAIERMSDLLSIRRRVIGAIPNYPARANRSQQSLVTRAAANHLQHTNSIKVDVSKFDFTGHVGLSGLVDQETRLPRLLVAVQSDAMFGVNDGNGTHYFNLLAIDAEIGLGQDEQNANEPTDGSPAAPRILGTKVSHVNLKVTLLPDAVVLRHESASAQLRVLSMSYQRNIDADLNHRVLGNLVGTQLSVQGRYAYFQFILDVLGLSYTEGRGLRDNTFGSATAALGATETELGFLIYPFGTQVAFRAGGEGHLSLLLGCRGRDVYESNTNKHVRRAYCSGGANGQVWGEAEVQLPHQTSIFVRGRVDQEGYFSGYPDVSNGKYWVGSSTGLQFGLRMNLRSTAFQRSSRGRPAPRR